MKTTIHRGFYWSAVFILFLLTNLSWAAQFDDEFQTRLNAMNENETITVLVFIKEQANLRAVRGNPARVLSTLHETSQRSQRSVLTLVTQLKALGQVTEVQNFWIINGLSITGTKKAILTLASNDTIAWIRESKTITIPPAEIAPRILAGPMAVEWNISKINVPQVWSTFGFRGEGITVASIDTGVDANHPDLAGRMGQIGNGGLGWFDAVNGQSSPYDDIGHGTHVTGTMVGGNRGGTDIGIVPNAHYYMAKAFAPEEGSEVDITEAAQWMMDPDANPATDDFPDIINNSWGGENPNNTWFESIYQSWEAMGIFSAFSAGNSGSANTISDPAGYPEVLAVGATTREDELAPFSSPGPVYWQEHAGLNPPSRTVIKPDVSAPGASIRSSIPGGGYESWNGTSMATPHVNGTAALMLQAAPSLTPAEIKNILCSTAVDLGDSGKDNNFGCGRIDAFEAVRLVATGGTLTGAVTDDGIGLAGVTVEVVGDVTTTTDNNGNYTVMVAAGTYTVHASKIGYLPQEVNDVVITEGETTTLDFVLEPAPSGTVSGTVIASNRDGQPLAATIYVLETDFSDNTNPDDGSYSIRLPSGTYTFQVSTHGGYRPTSVSVEVIADENTVQNFVLEAYDAYEENNSLNSAKAWPIELGIPLTEGTIEPAGDHDYFKFNGEAGQVITIDVDANSLNPSSLLDSELYLYNSDGDQLFYNDDYDGSDSQIVEFPLPSDDIYYIMVRNYESLDGGPEYSYHLKVDLDGFTNADAYEPNNDFEHATGISIGSSLSEAIINPEGDYDYFKFKGSAEQVITIDVDAMSLNPPSSLDSVLYLYNSVGDQLAYNDDYGGSDSDSRIVGFPLLSDDTYYLLVKDYDDLGGEGYFYTLYLSLVAPSNLVAKSGQDYRIPLTWDSTTSNSSAKSPTLDKTGLNNFTGYNVHRGMTPGGPYNLANNEPISATSYIDETVENGINYYYVVTGLYSNGIETGRSNEAVARAGALDINEPNDMPATATSLAMGETAVALIQVARDVDYYAFEASVGQGIVLDVDTDEYSQLDSVLSLITLDAESEEVVLVTNDDYDGTDSRIEYVIESAETYYAKVEGYSPSYGVEYTYSLRLTGPEPPQNLQAVGLDGVVELTWMPPEEIHYVPAKKPSYPVVPNDLIGYKLYRSEVSGGPYEQIGTIIEDSLYTDANVQNGVTYYYVVTAIRSESGESRYSNEASATLQIRYGDVSNDGSISPYDASLILQSVAGLKELDSNEFEKADVTNDGKVTAFDAAIVMHYIVGLIDKFPAEGGSGAPK